MPQMTKVLKWPMDAPVREFEMTVGSKVIEVAEQNDIPTLWSLGPANGPTEKRTFIGYGTGHPIFEENLTYVGSAHRINGDLVFHIFERPQ